VLKVKHALLTVLWKADQKVDINIEKD